MSDLSVTPISGTLKKLNGDPYFGFVRFRHWNRYPSQAFVGSLEPIQVPTGSDGYFEANLRPAYYFLEVGPGSPSRIMVPQREADDAETIYDLSTLFVTSATAAGGVTFYYGNRSEAVMTEEIALAMNKLKTTSCQGARRFPTANVSTYKYFVWDDSLGSPRSGDGFRDARTKQQVSMAGSAEGFDESENGWNYALLSVGDSAHRVYRTRQPIAAEISIDVQK